ncbi:hypothetical protein EVG20_g10946 [Dentipellis fragilis]|uniref:C2H2-type domain-containing protein n=1 Tax=Dentipellis fragilis TaxID=205917 RepID=A0A4Y9XP83_9AGAM|nr:hypothetical protein EVG20_g10946 [Dentipellis fragilis]
MDKSGWFRLGADRGEGASHPPDPYTASTYQTRVSEPRQTSTPTRMNRNAYARLLCTSFRPSGDEARSALRPGGPGYLEVESLHLACTAPSSTELLPPVSSAFEMYRQDQSNAMPHPQVLMIPCSMQPYNFTPRSIATPVPGQRQVMFAHPSPRPMRLTRCTPRQHSSPQRNLDTCGAYEFANLLASPVRLYITGVFLAHISSRRGHPPRPATGAPQDSTYNFPDEYALRAGPYECRYVDAPDNSYAPPARHPEGMFSSSQWGPGPAPSSSTPRACLPPTADLGYAPPVPALATAVNLSNIPNDYLLWQSSLGSISHTSSYHEVLPPPNPMGPGVLPEVAPTPPYPPTWYDEQPLAQASVMFGYSGSMPGYDAINTHYSSGGAGCNPAGQFQALQYPEQSRPRASTSSQAESGYEQSKRLKLERVAPVVRQTTRSERQTQTLTEHIIRTQVNDLGHEATLDQFAARYLIVPLQGPSTPPSTPGARAKTGRRKTRENRIPKPPGMPKAIRIGHKKYRCPYAECRRTCTSTHDVERHYWEHLPARVKWSCTLCGGRYTRHYNALRHFRVAHNPKGPHEGQITMDWPPMGV